MTLASWLSHLWILFVAFSAAFVEFMAARIALAYYNDWRTGVREGRRFDLSTNIWIALVFASALNLIAFAILDVGRAREILVENAQALAMIYGALLGAPLAYKGYTKGQDIKSETLRGALPRPPVPRDGEGDSR